MQVCLVPPGSSNNANTHCRSAYFRLGHMLEQRVQCRCVLALTATATKATEADVTKVLKISPENVVRDSTVRDNLRLSVTHFNGGKPPVCLPACLSVCLSVCHCRVEVMCSVISAHHADCTSQRLNDLSTSGCCQAAQRKP